MCWLAVKYFTNLNLCEKFVLLKSMETMWLKSKNFAIYNFVVISFIFYNDHKQIIISNKMYMYVKEIKNMLLSNEFEVLCMI